MALKRSSVRFRLAPPASIEIIQFVSSHTRSMAKLTNSKALTFDCYGTLIHWESGMIEALKPLTRKSRGSSSATKFSRRTRAMNRPSKPRPRRNSIESFWRLFIAAWPKNGAWRQAGAIAWPMAGRELAGRSPIQSALQYLKRHYKLAILSNVDNESFSFATKSSGSISTRSILPGLRLLQAL